MRGYQKRVIYMKNTGSRHFEEAYFIVKESCGTEESSSAEMIDEANRIIEENFEKRRGGFFYLKRWYITAFLIGCAATLSICALVYFLS